MYMYIVSTMQYLVYQPYNAQARRCLSASCDRSRRRGCQPQGPSFRSLRAQAQELPAEMPLCWKQTACSTRLLRLHATRPSSRCSVYALSLLALLAQKVQILTRCAGHFRRPATACFFAGGRAHASAPARWCWQRGRLGGGVGGCRYRGR